MKKLEYLAYICLISLSIISGTVLIRHAWLEHKVSVVAYQKPEDLIGKQLNLSQAPWKKETKNLVLYISTQCHFCEESMPFYQSIINAHTHNFSVIFLTPDPPEKLRAYLLHYAITPQNVYQIKIPDALLKGIPTALVVDDHGVIQRADIGYLDIRRQQYLLHALGA